MYIVIHDPSQLGLVQGAAVATGSPVLSLTPQQVAGLQTGAGLGPATPLGLADPSLLPLLAAQQAVLAPSPGPILGLGVPGSPGPGVLGGQPDPNSPQARHSLYKVRAQPFPFSRGPAFANPFLLLLLLLLLLLATDRALPLVGGDGRVPLRQQVPVRARQGRAPAGDPAPKVQDRGLPHLCDHRRLPLWHSLQVHPRARCVVATSSCLCLLELLLPIPSRGPAGARTTRIAGRIPPPALALAAPAKESGSAHHHHHHQQQQQGESREGSAGQPKQQQQQGGSVSVQQEEELVRRTASAPSHSLPLPSAAHHPHHLTHGPSPLGQKAAAAAAAPGAILDPSVVGLGLTLTSLGSGGSTPEPVSPGRLGSGLEGSDSPGRRLPVFNKMAGGRSL